MRCVSFLLIGLLAIGCGKNASQPAAPPAAADDEDDSEAPAPARHRLGTPAVFLPGGKSALTNDPALYELATGRRLWTFNRHQGRVHSVAVSPNEETALSAGDDGTIKYWPLINGKLSGTLTGHQGEVDCVAFTRDSQRALSGGRDGTVRIWDLKTGTEVKTLGTHKWIVHFVAVSPDGRRAASVCPGDGVKVWDLATSKLAWEFDRPAEGLQVAAFSPDGKRVLLGGKRIRVCEAATGNLVTLLDVGLSVWSVAYLPDGEHVVTAGEDGIPRLWDLKGGRIERTYRLSGDAVGFVSVSPDGKQAISDTRLLWDLTTGETIGKISDVGFSASALTMQIAFSPDRRRALTAYYEPVLWDVATGKRLRDFPDALDSGRIAFSPDGKHFQCAATAWRIVQVFDVETGKEVSRFEGHRAPVRYVGFSPDGRLAIAGGNPDQHDGHTLRLWEVASGKEIRAFQGHKGALTFAGFLPDGKRVLSADTEGIYLWDVDSGKRLPTVPDRGARLVTLSPDGKYALFHGGGLGSRSSVWDTTTFQEERLLPEDCGFASAALSPGGKTVLYVGGGGLLHVLDVATGKKARLAPTIGKLTGFWAVAFSPDGRLACFQTKLIDFGQVELRRLSMHDLDSLRRFPDR